MEASCWGAREIFLSPAIASSSALTLDSRPTTNGVIMYGKMTTSRMGIIGRRFVSDFSFDVSIVLRSGARVPARRRRYVGDAGDYPAFSNIVRLIFWVSTISLVTRNSRTFL